MVLLGLGSNVGSRFFYLSRAIRSLKSVLDHVHVSPVYESDALLPDGAPKNWDHPYYNLVLKGETSLSPAQLLKEVKRIEASIGRKKRERWAPREIDIDLLYLDGVELNENDLCIPHRDLYKRPFVLLPLLDLCPNWINQENVQRSLSSWSEMPFRTKKVFPKTHTQWVGILNVTPDSFSDGGKFIDESSMAKQLEALVEQGADIIDVGGESTRPGSRFVSPEQEWERVKPALDVFRSLFKSNPPILSLDTRRWEVAQKGLEMGVNWINDVTGFDDPKMLKLLESTDATAVFMHHLGVPPTKEKIIDERAPAATLIDWCHQKLKRFEEEGIPRDRLIFDPGIGFGKSALANWDLLRDIEHLIDECGCRLLVGHSRKSFLNAVTDLEFEDRDLETAVIASKLAVYGVDFVRVHQVSTSIRATRVSEPLSLC